MATDRCLSFLTAIQEKTHLFWTLESKNTTTFSKKVQSVRVKDCWSPNYFSNGKFLNDFSRRHTVRNASCSGSPSQASSTPSCCRSAELAAYHGDGQRTSSLACKFRLRHTLLRKFGKRDELVEALKGAQASYHAAL